MLSHTCAATPSALRAGVECQVCVELRMVSTQPLQGVCVRVEGVGVASSALSPMMVDLEAGREWTRQVMVTACPHLRDRGPVVILRYVVTHPSDDGRHLGRVEGAAVLPITDGYPV